MKPFTFDSLSTGIRLLEIQILYNDSGLFDVQLHFVK